MWLDTHTDTTLYTHKQCHSPHPWRFSLVLTHIHSWDGHAWPVFTSNKVHRDRTQINKQHPSLAPNIAWPLFLYRCLGFKHTTLLPVFQVTCRAFRLPYCLTCLSVCLFSRDLRVRHTGWLSGQVTLYLAFFWQAPQMAQNGKSPI